MAFARHIRRFAKCSTGAITVEWVVLVAGVVMLVLLVGGPIQDGVASLAQVTVKNMLNTVLF